MAVIQHGPNEILSDVHFGRFRNMLITFIIVISLTVMTEKYGAELSVYEYYFDTEGVLD